VVAGQFALMPGGPLRTGADRKGQGGGSRDGEVRSRSGDAGGGKGQGGSGDATGNRPKQQQP